MVTDTRKNLRHSVVRFVHQIVQNQQSSLRSVKRCHIGQSVVKLYVFQLVKEILIDSITPHNLLRWRVDQCGSVLDKFSSEYGLARTTRTGYDGCEWVFEIHRFLLDKIFMSIYTM